MGENKIVLEDEKDFLVWAPRDHNTVEIVDVCVGSERRRGRGRELLRQLFRIKDVARARVVWAITRSTNLIAQQWYEACGFYVDRVLRNYYDPNADCADAIVYARDPRGPMP